MKWMCQFLLLGVALASCSEISYLEPQPKGIKALALIPEKLQGSFLVTEGKETDTLWVSPAGYRIGKDDLAGLSDSLILKYYRGYYFLNFREGYAWYVRVIKRQKSGDLLFLEMDGLSGTDDEKKKFIDKLSTELKVVETLIDDKPGYVIDPEPKQLVKLIKKGYFKKSTFKKIQ